MMIQGHDLLQDDLAIEPGVGPWLEPGTGTGTGPGHELEQLEPESVQVLAGEKFQRVPLEMV